MCQDFGKHPVVIPNGGEESKKISPCGDCVKTAFMLRVASARTVVELARSSYLTVRPELRRRAPMGFSHSLTNVRDLGFLPEPALSIAEGVEMTREKDRRSVIATQSLRVGED
jgi:hypothetical protein